MRISTAAGIPLLVLCLTACSPQQLYSSGQGWRRSGCDKVMEHDRQRCLEEANAPFSQYQREREPDRGAKGSIGVPLVTSE